MAQLHVVGSGIRANMQLTPEARQRITGADEVFYLTAHWVADDYIRSLNPNSTSLAELYGEAKHRQDSYREMVDAILAPLHRGRTVCAVFYGHPGVFVNPGHEAVRRAREAGFKSTMLPGISAEDCLFADLGLDPGANGCQSYLGQDFVNRALRFDVNTPLILWQVAAIGDPANSPEPNARGIEMLSQKLEQHYGADHDVVIYVAAILPVGECTIERTTIAQLAATEVSSAATLFVPPLGPAPRDEAT